MNHVDASHNLRATRIGSGLSFALAVSQVLLIGILVSCSSTGHRGEDPSLSRECGVEQLGWDLQVKPQGRTGRTWEYRVVFTNDVAERVAVRIRPDSSAASPLEPGDPASERHYQVQRPQWIPLANYAAGNATEWASLAVDDRSTLVPTACVLLEDSCGTRVRRCVDVPIV